MDQGDANPGIRPDPPRNAPTPRIAAAVDCLARREKADFHISDLRAFLEEHGFDCPRHYPSMLARNCRNRGLVRETGRGRYRVFRDHSEITARG